jgi:hypothetical protein
VVESPAFNARIPLMLGILLAASVAAASPPPAAHPLPCPATHPQKTAARDRVGPKKLGELPDAEAYHAVWKEAGGCPIDEVYQNGRWVDRWSGQPAPAPRQTDGDRR